MFLNYFNVLKLKIILLKKYYFNIFLNKKNLKYNNYHPSKLLHSTFTLNSSAWYLSV